MQEVWVVSSEFFLSVFMQFELSHFFTQLLQKHIDTGYLVNATPPTILA